MFVSVGRQMKKVLSLRQLSRCFSNLEQNLQDKGNNFQTQTKNLSCLARQGKKLQTQKKPSIQCSNTDKTSRQRKILQTQTNCQETTFRHGDKPSRQGKQPSKTDKPSRQEKQPSNTITPSRKQERKTFKHGQKPLRQQHSNVNTPSKEGNKFSTMDKPS